MAIHITSAIDYDANLLEPLVSTFVSNTFCDTLHILVNTENYQSYIERFIHLDRVKIVPIEKSNVPLLPERTVFLVHLVRTILPFRYCRRVLRFMLDKKLIDNSLKHSIEVLLAWKYSSRWAIYEEYISKMDDIDCQLILLDARDCIVLSDFPTDNTDIVLTCEPSIVKFGSLHSSGRLNTTWYKDLFASSEYRLVSGMPVVCAGVIAGPKKEMLQFLAMVNSVISTKVPGVGPRDQAVVNYIAYRHYADKIVDTSNIFLHVAAMTDVDITQLLHSLSNNTCKPCIIHQYDRHSLLMKYFKIID